VVAVIHDSRKENDENREKVFRADSKGLLQYLQCLKMLKDWNTLLEAIDSGAWAKHLDSVTTVGWANAAT
jgi:hypothetical protein